MQSSSCHVFSSLMLLDLTYAQEGAAHHGLCAMLFLTLKLSMQTSANSLKKTLLHSVSAVFRNLFEFCLLSVYLFNQISLNFLPLCSHLFYLLYKAHSGLQTAQFTCTGCTEDEDHHVAPAARPGCFCFRSIGCTEVGNRLLTIGEQGYGMISFLLTNCTQWFLHRVCSSL